ncbi:BTAD domain-containing putative transcriptional regulator [Glycomyces buryatensis]|uniref:AfsR/SARP family transcriptional regulator n=1 Tax=Glycomyces buryatensis TaxID=2570927 RepID=A0A4S8QL62_9ACTN|nr:BTAD domain-containing putative transcriptional regulator [Glycomyces buryatensis]THV41464.1 AfsR/SARP family transcriptional regulator [Glycomyces buryatensis]
MRVLLLGPFAVRDDEDRPVQIAGARLRALIARLALEPGREISADALTDAIWDGESPSANALQALVSRVRRLIGTDRLTRGAAGYRLAIDAGDVDLLSFERLAETGRSTGDLAALRQAETLWRGRAFADLLDLPFASSEAFRLERLRTETTRERMSIEVAAGVDVLAELEPLAAAHPLDERWQALLMRALYATGRGAAALDAFERARERLADDLGADPSPDLAELHLQILRQETEPAAPSRRRRTNLKAQLTSLVGRDDDLATLAAALQASRLVTVTGPGGSGKTRLAVEAASRAEALAPEGIWMVELAAVAEPGDIAPAVLRAIGAREAGLLEPSVQDAASRLEEFLAEQRTMLLLDNCEHQIAAVADLTARLLGACPGLRVLATSREALVIGGERLYPIPPLSWSEADPNASAAVRLFCERAAAVRPGFGLNEANTPAVVEICRRLDGLPLAVELAAARMRALDASQIAARLDDRFALLTAADRNAPARHRTLEAVIAWSWELLSESERALAMRLSVYPAGVGLDRVDDIDALAGLVDKSLVERDGDRYRMLETIRSYAAAQLEPSGRAEEEREARTRYCVALAERSDAELRSTGQLEARAQTQAEHDNLIAAVRRCVAQGDKELGLRLIGALFWYWHLCGLHTERLHWTRAVLELPGEVPAFLRATERVLTGLLHAEAGDFEASEAAITAGLAAARESEVEAASGADARSPDPLVAGPGRFLLSIAPAFLANPAGAAAAGPEPSGWERGITLLLASDATATNRDAIDRVEQARAEFDRLGERWGHSSALRILAEHRSRLGEHEAELAAYDQAARLLDELGVAADAAEAYAEAAVARARIGEFAPAQAALDLAFERAETSREPRTIAYVRWARAQFLFHSGEDEAALRELDEAEASFDNTALEARIRVWGSAIRAMIALCSKQIGRARGALDGLTAAHFEGAMGPDLAMLARLYAALVLAEGNAERAANLIGAAAALLGTEDRRGYDTGLRTDEEVRELLGDKVFKEQYDRGAALERDAAVEAIRSESLRH